MAVSGAGRTDGRVLDRIGAVSVGLASLFGAVAGYAILTIAARVLVPTSRNTEFVTFWSVFFVGIGALTGLSTEVLRGTTASRTDRSTREGSGATGVRVLPLGIGVGLSVGAIVAATSPLWAGSVFPRDPRLALVLAAALAAFSVHVVVLGALGGAGRWRAYSGLIAIESAVRLAGIAVATAAGATVVSYAIALVFAEFAWLVVLAVSAPARRAARARTDLPLRPFLRRSSAAAVSSGIAAFLVVGFPLLLTFTTSVEAYALAAPVLLAISLTRAPLLLPLSAYQGIVIARMVTLRDRGPRIVLPLLGAVGAVAGVASLAAFWIGPTVMGFLLGPSYVISGSVLAGLTAGAGALALLTLTGATCQAFLLHGWYMAGWLVALAVACGLLAFLPGSVAARSVTALLVGPAVGVAVHLVGMFPPRRWVGAASPRAATVG